MTKPKLKEGMMYAKNSHVNGFQVPESVTIADDATLGWNCRSISKGCVIGEEVVLDTSIGDNVTIGAKTYIERSTIGDNIRIGSHCAIQTSAIVDDGVTIGDNVIIGTGCTLRKGVNVPDNWLIPDGAIVNPGLDGTPCVIFPPPRFNCNVRGSITAGRGNSW